MNLAQLSDPFPRAAVSWRIQGQPIERNGQWMGMALAYIDARDVMDRLDEVCGPANWQTEFNETAKGRVIGRIGIRVDGEWIWKSDGAGDTAVEGEKGGISDALKRAAVNWGIGRYLYALDAPWCPCEVKQSNGKTYFKKWIGSPWDHVRNASADPSPAPRQQPHAQQDSVPQSAPAAIAELKAKLLRNTDNHTHPRFQADLTALRGMDAEAASEVDDKIKALSEKAAA